MWDHVIAQNGRIAANSTLRRFVDTWLDAVQAGHAYRWAQVAWLLTDIHDGIEEDAGAPA
jgi:hypothetical protein